MKVDLPAPLSPSTQVTSPARTDVVTSRSAMTLPYDLPMSLTSMIASPGSAAGSGPTTAVDARGCPR